LEKARRILIQDLSSRGYLRTQSVIDAFMKVPREFFVPDKEVASAYDDRPLPIGLGQTISAPHMVAIMTELLDVEAGSKILEVGCGSGYQAAILAEMVENGFVYSVERIPELVEMAKRNLGKCGYRNVEVLLGDGTLGYPEKAPYDRIIVTAAAPRVPMKLVEQLGEGGIMLVPAGQRYSQDLIMVRKESGKVVIENHGGCVFVPLIGEDGW
jgi:protein-L-isoaspartate(D-aspartate) O-methyltransferase